MTWDGDVMSDEWSGCRGGTFDVDLNVGGENHLLRNGPRSHGRTRAGAMAAPTPQNAL